MNTAARPRSVYWRRRALLAAATTTGMIMLIHSCASSGPPHLQMSTKESLAVPLTATYTPTSTPTPTPTATAAATTAPTGSPTAATAVSPVPTAPAKGGKHAALTALPPSPLPTAAAAPVIPACLKSDLAVELRTDAPSYSGKAKPKFYIGVSNIGNMPCRVDLGSVALSFTVKSGPDRIWSSRDCQGKGTHDVRTLAPGQQLWGRSVWSKVRSAKGCPEDEPAARAGTYTLDGSAAGVKAGKKVVFRLR